MRWEYYCPLMRDKKANLPYISFSIPQFIHIFTYTSFYHRNYPF
ncbi:hypothetical protein EMIT079MI2_410025 [Bacillus sp. IT-79MI2]